jgi:alpha-1,2-mannosyltransferase
VFTSLTIVPQLLLPLVALLANLAALIAVVWVSFGRQGFVRDHGRVAATAALTALGLALQPVLANFSAGQVNLILMALILCDLTGRDRRWTGVGVGIAAGVKLIPIIFVAYLLVTRRFRAAAVTVGTFALTIAVGFAILPGQSKLFWAANLVSPQRITGDGDASAAENQTLRGLMARLVGIPDVSNAVWIPAAALVCVLGLVIAVRAHRSNRELLAVSVMGATMVLLSPVGWSHYWIWFLPFLIMVIGTALRTRSWIPWAVAAAGYLLVFSWPVDHGRNNVPVVGLVVLPERAPMFLQIPAHGLYTSLGLILLAVAAVRPNWLSEPVIEDNFLTKT